MKTARNILLDNRIDEMLSSEMSARLARAKTYLELQMDQLGLRPDEGWKIREELRDTDTGTRWVVFRPVHLRRDAPNLQSSVVVAHKVRAK